MKDHSKPFYISLGLEIKEAREKARLSVDHIAREVGLSKKIIEDIEAGRRMFSVWTLNMILKIIDADQSRDN